MVDHIIPVRHKDDPLFWNPKNWQPLCRKCDNKKKRLDKWLREAYDSGLTLDSAIKYARRRMQERLE